MRFHAATIAALLLSMSLPAGAQNCPGGAIGNCFTAHSTPGCQEPTCCEAVCIVDPFCCATAWDGQCAVIAGFSCEPPPPVDCGAAGLGDCFTAHATPGCALPTCCGTVCELLPTCCSVAWDATCVSAAYQLCPPVCVPACPTPSIVEAEDCTTVGFGNDPCPSGTPAEGLQQLISGRPACGSIQFIAPPGSTVGVPERDAYRIVLPDPDGDGQARVLMSIQAERGTADSGTVPLFVALVRTACDGLQTAALHTQGIDCQPAFAQGCVAAGEWIAVVCRGTFPAAEVYPYNCLNGVQSYVLTVEWNDGCGEACGDAGNCFAVHTTPGCVDASCCEAVCAVAPDCCTDSWDQPCVSQALALCQPAVPSNDACAGAEVIGLGAHDFALVSATPSSLAVPAECFGTATAGRDVWFRLQGLRGEVSVSACGIGSFDSALVLYGGECPSAGSPVIACSNDTIACTQNPKSAAVSFTAQCGSEYLLRVLAVGSAQGGGTLMVTATQPACVACVADLDGDGQVAGTDLTILLSSWGSGGPADISGNGVVSGEDLTILLSSWGDCP